MPPAPEEQLLVHSGVVAVFCDTVELVMVTWAESILSNSRMPPEKVEQLLVHSGVVAVFCDTVELVMARIPS